MVTSDTVRARRIRRNVPYAAARWATVTAMLNTCMNSLMTAGRASSPLRLASSMLTMPAATPTRCHAATSWTPVSTATRGVRGPRSRNPTCSPLIRNVLEV